MSTDNYFPDDLVDKGKAILIQLCEQIETKQPASDDEFYALTHAATEAFNDLPEEFGEQGSEIETVARDTIGVDFEVIAKAYEFGHLDVEELISPRDW